ncbi:MAG: hypothetical protein ACI9NQ_000509 [Paracoccaceae bacterium]|jgi:hypothetical protein
MHQALIPTRAFDPGSSTTFEDSTPADIYRRLTVAPRRGFWITAAISITMVAVGIVLFGGGERLLAVVCLTVALVMGTLHYLARHKLNVALWVSREPWAVYWAEPRGMRLNYGFTSQKKVFLALHTPAQVGFEAAMRYEDIIFVLRWLRHHNPSCLIGFYSPDDSDGRLSGDDPHSVTSLQQTRIFLDHYDTQQTHKAEQDAADQPPARRDLKSE